MSALCSVRRGAVLRAVLLLDPNDIAPKQAKERRSIKIGQKLHSKTLHLHFAFALHCVSSGVVWGRSLGRVLGVGLARGREKGQRMAC